MHVREVSGSTKQFNDVSFMSCGGNIGNVQWTQDTSKRCVVTWMLLDCVFHKICIKKKEESKKKKLQVFFFVKWLILLWTRALTQCFMTFIWLIPWPSYCSNGAFAVELAAANTRFSLLTLSASGRVLDTLR